MDSTGNSSNPAAAASSDQKEATVTLEAGDGEKFSVPISVISMSELIKQMVEEAEPEESIPIPNISSATLEKVIEYCTMHRDKPAEEIPKPLKTSNFAEVVSAEDFKFVDIDQAALFDLILAANFLDIKGLLDLTCGKVASMIKGKSPEEIRKQFNIINDFTPEEEAQIREENKWCEDA